MDSPHRSPVRDVGRPLGSQGATAARRWGYLRAAAPYPATLHPLWMVRVSKQRFWATIRQSTRRQKLDTRSLLAPTLAMAETMTQRWLRTARLTKVDGREWDTWEVRVNSGPGGLPVLVAHGDHLRTAYTAREHGWTDKDA